jgi:energy-coupling factor transport system permease protein
VLVVGQRATPPSIIARDWWLMGRLVGWLVGVSVVMNLLLTRAGDWPLISLPRDWPGLGGDLTLNALLFGLLAALSLLVVLAAWAVFNAAVGQGDLLSLVPRPLYLAGAAGAIALTFVPGMLRAAREIGEAQAVRGHRARGWRDLPPLAVPLLSLGLERGLSLAEAMEARGFGATLGAPGRSGWWLAVGLAALALGGPLLLASPWPALGFLALAGGGLALWLGLRQAGPGRSRYRRQRWRPGDTLVAGLALASLALLVAARLSGDTSLDYAVYPTLTPPPVSAWVLALPPLLLGPALNVELERA